VTIVHDLSHVVSVLERTPATLEGMLRGAPPDLVRATEGAGSWSPFDVVGHLIHGERTDWIPRLKTILAEGESRPFEPFDRFAQFESSTGRSLEELLEEFASLRANNLGVLRALLAEGIDLAAPGRHPDLGRVTAGQLLSTWAAHDLGHIAQIARVMARQFGARTGPWRAYLPILRER
jgi:hypothetical protein